jgi:hypothetical protein
VSDDDEDQNGGFGGRDDDAKYHPVPKNFERRITDDLKRLWEMPPYDKIQNLEAKQDNFSVYRERYLAMGVEPANTRYGWIRTSL